MRTALAQQAPAANKGKLVAGEKPALQDPTVTDPAAIEKQLRSKLSQKTSIEASELPLKQFIKQLSEQTDVPMVLDARSVEEIGLSGEVPVSLSLNNVSLRSVLRNALHPLGLAYVIQDEVVHIMTLEAVEGNLVTRVYALADPLKDKPKKVIHAIIATVNPDTWEVIGGPSTIVAINNLLIVSATEQTHEQIDSLLQKIESALQTRKSP
ncbi:hypothetical protein SH528x_004906 [Novipirellula sp. SH528]|uniref:hypothetical protein n=1 Tax=Novipirellula sp. SH528 TaxID=3454466 RepID=UPI003F9F2EE9